MAESVQYDPLLKQVLRAAWTRCLDLQVCLAQANPADKAQPRVFYGGARAGDIGGPKVKVQRLQQFFPEVPWRFNTVYLLSNAPYLSARALSRLKSRQVPIVLNQNGVFYSGWFAGDWRAKNAEMAMGYHAADHVFFQSTFCREAAGEFLGPRQGPGEVLFNAIDTNHFSPRDDFTSTREPYRFLVTGKIGMHLMYRLDTAIRGLAGVRSSGLDAELEIAGWLDPEAQSTAQALAGELGVAERVVFSGRYTQHEAPDIYRRADAYLMTKHNDPCPNTVLEALACGLPVVYSNTGGVPELVDDCGIGLTCEESWSEAKSPRLDDVINGMLAVNRNHESFAVKARERAIAQFDIEDWIARHRDVFAALLHGKASS